MDSPQLKALFNKKAGLAAMVVATAIALPAWSCYRHDQAVQAGFLSEAMRDATERVVTVETDGVIRQGMLNRGAAIPNIMLGFYNHPSQAFVIASSPQASCLYANLQVVGGQDHLPFWQKLVDGGKYETSFANPIFGNWFEYNCAPLADHSPQ